MVRMFSRAVALRHEPIGWWLKLLWAGCRSGIVPLIVGTAAMCGVTIALLLVEGAVGMYLFTLTPIVMPLLASGVTLIIAAGVVWRKFIATATDNALRQRKCPTCDYDLAAVEDGMGLTSTELLTCPECGNQWRAGRVGSTGPEAVKVVTIHWD
jgi:hypothetical protein